MRYICLAAAGELTPFLFLFKRGPFPLMWESPTSISLDISGARLSCHWVSLCDVMEHQRKITAHLLHALYPLGKDFSMSVNICTSVVCTVLCKSETAR